MKIYVSKNGKYYDEADMIKAFDIVLGIDKAHAQALLVNLDCTIFGSIKEVRDMNEEDLINEGNYALALKCCKDENPHLSIREAKNRIDYLCDKRLKEKEVL